MAKVLSKPKAPKIIEVPVVTPPPAPVVETPVDTVPEPTARATPSASPKAAALVPTAQANR
jgi:hypothetical protein